MSTSATLVDRVRAELRGLPKVTERKMFGATAFLVNDKMCISADANSIMCRIDPALHDAAAAQPGCSTVVMGGRAYRGYIDIAASALPTKASLRHWVDLALAFNKVAKRSRKK